MAIEHHDVIVDGDLVGLRWTWQATHSGPFLGMPPTGARVSIDGYDLIVVRDGKIRGRLGLPGQPRSHGPARRGRGSRG